MVKKFLSAAYKLFINGNRAVIYYYTLSKYRHQKIYRYFPILLWVYAFWLVIKYRVFKADKKSGLPDRESDLKIYPAISKMVKKVSKYDVISFDVFDTLMLRRVNSPEDVFELIGEKLGVINYKVKRIFAEQEARRRSPSGEVTLKDICDILKELYSIESSKAYEVELETERELCFANPYYVRLFKDSCLCAKKVIAVSDMYLPPEFIQELLSVNGFAVDKLYVSCEYGCSKANGRLWKIVKSDYKNKRLLHVGDNYISDMKMCGKAGVDFVGVPNITWMCKSYRDCGVNSLVMSVYSAQINSRLHTAECKFSKFYEHGYTYGGILSYGYCSWIDKLAKERGYDLLLFTARDSKVFYDIYKKYFDGVRSEYLFISRFAALKLALENNYDMFVEIMFRSKARRIDKISFATALEQADIGCLINKLSVSHLNCDTELNEFTVDSLVSFLIAHRDEVIVAYQNDRIAFGRYITSIIEDAKNVCVIDLGWRGTVYSLLSDYFIKNGNNVRLEGAMLGTTDSQISNGLVEIGKLHCYSFSHRHNINYMVDEKKIILLEVLYSSNSPSVTGYKISGKNGIPVFGTVEESKSCCFEDMHKGIFDFCEEFSGNIELLPYFWEITGAEAVGPIYYVSLNSVYNLSLFSGVKTSLEPNSKPKDLKKYFS